MSIQVTFTTEQFEKNAATILAILTGGVASSTEASQKEETTATATANKAAGSKTTTRKTAAASKTAPKDEPKVSLQEAKDALIAVKDDENLGIAECRRIMKEAGVPDAKMANMAQEHAEKVLELAKMLLDGGSEEEGDGDDL